MSVRSDAIALDAPATDEETALGAAIRESANAVLTARGSSELGLSELLATVLATLVNDVPVEDMESLKMMAPGICNDVFAAATACASEGEFDSVDGERISMKLPTDATEKLAVAAAEPVALPTTASVVDEVMSAAEAAVAEKAVGTSDAASGEPLVDKAAVIEAPTADAVVEGSGAIDPVDDAAVVTTGTAAVKPSDSVSQVASEASTVIEKVETLLDAVVLSHNAINERLDSFGQLLLKTSGTPMSDKTSRETILYLQDMYNPKREADKINTTTTHTGVDLAALVANARARHGL